MFQRTMPANTKMRVVMFLSAFHNADNNADIEIRIGRSGDGEAALLISLPGSEHALMVTEALKVADIMEESMLAHPEDPESRTLPNIIMTLREGAKQADIIKSLDRSTK